MTERMLYAATTVLRPELEEADVERHVRESIAKENAEVAARVHIAVEPRSIGGLIDEFFGGGAADFDEADTEYAIPDDDGEGIEFAGHRCWSIRIDDPVASTDDVTSAIEEVRFWIFENGMELTEEFEGDDEDDEETGF